MSNLQERLLYCTKSERPRPLSHFYFGRAAQCMDFFNLTTGRGRALILNFVGGFSRQHHSEHDTVELLKHTYRLIELISEKISPRL